MITISGDTVMTEKKGIHKRLFVKVYINYALMVVLFAVLSGTIFMGQIKNATTGSYKTQLFKQARDISKRLNAYITDEEYTEGLVYLQMLPDAGVDEVWAFSNPNAAVPMNSDMDSGLDINDAYLSEGQKSVIKAAFQNKETYSTTFSEIHGLTVLTVGVPIIGANGEACGALILNSPIASQTETVNSTMSLIFSSAIFALIISFIVAILFARQLSRPISRMRHTALELAEGKYENKTGIRRSDEIGDLAKTIDFLTDKLMENDRVRKNLEQMRMDFFANVSHELRTPITVVRAYTESLVDGVVTEDEKRLQYYDKMLSECKSMERLVGDLLTLSKMQNPDFAVDKEPINLLQIFEEIIRTVAVIGEEKNIEIKLNKDREYYMMFGDYDRLRQMFLVILDNAVKFSKDNSKIYVNVFQTNKIYISIRDEGIGIVKEELTNIFEKFYKSKLRQNAKGSGLGLAIAKQIALKHGGDINVTSEVNVGTEFLFNFDFISEKEMEQMRECGI